jgi:protein-S-isoprenylcysteine O-methyltransferase Ste14
VSVLFLKNLAFTLLVPGSVAVYIPLRLLQDLPAPSLGGQLASLPFFAIGLLIYSWCVWDFATFGGGTPAPIDAPKVLVVRGLYRYTRNPMYVGVLTTVLAWAIRYRSPAIVLYAFVVWLCFQSFIVFYEEPHLQRVFGDTYTQYRARVGRWLPRF